MAQVVMLELCVERKELLAPQRPQVPLSVSPALRHCASAFQLYEFAVVARTGYSLAALRTSADPQKINVW